MSIHQKALQQAIMLLRSIGAQFAIMHDGVKHGDLEIVQINTSKRQRNSPVHHWHAIYGPWLSSARQGSTFQHTCETMEQAESLRGSVSSQVSRKFGSGGGMSAITHKPGVGFVVEALVTADAPVTKEQS